MLNQEVRRIMTTNPIVATPDQSIEEISNIILKGETQQMPVVQEGKLVGMITTFDLWKKMSQSKETDLKVKDVMTENIIKITPIDKVGTAAELFMDKRFKTLPVVNLRNELKGIVTAFDVIKHTLKKEYDHPILYKEVIQS